MPWQWQNSDDLAPRSYICGYCGTPRIADKGYLAKLDHGDKWAFIYICDNCTRPTFFSPYDDQVPGPIYSHPVRYIEDPKVGYLYEEARKCAAHQNYTASVLCCRKLLMNVAVQKGAAEGQSFSSYVEYLGNLGFLPPDGKQWVDLIRQKGNEAAHQIAQMSKDDSDNLLSFVYMLLVFIYEFPGTVERRIKSKK